MPVKFKGPGQTPGSKESIGSKLFVSLFFAIFLSAGLFFAGLIIREVMLKDEKLAMLLFLIIPLIFIYIGGGGLYVTWLGKAGDSKRLPKKADYIRGKRTGNAGLVFGWLFVAVGLVACWFMLVRPVYSVARAAGWKQVPCRILSARLESHRSSEGGTTYSIEIEYEYEVGGRTCRNDRYDFFVGSTGGREGKQTVVNRYRTAANPVCYVNPQDPADAVLVRKLTPRYALGLLPLLFVIVGAAVVAKSRPRRAAGMPDWIPVFRRPQSAAVLEGSPASDAPMMLRPESTPLKKMLIALVFCLFWNGVISVFLAEVVNGFRAGRPQWFLTVFMIPFVLVGLGAAGVVIYQFLALFNPRYTLALKPARLVPGSAGQLRWQASGLAGRVRKLTVQLVGTEKATYRRGTKTRTDQNVFYSLDLLTTEDPLDITAGKIDLAIPNPTMHTFNARNNKIVWSIRLRGDIARWPDVSQNYPFTVYPHSLAEVKS